MDALLTVDEVAGLLRVARSTVYRYKELGLPYFKIGNSLRFSREQVMAWVRSHQVRKPYSPKGFYSWAEQLAREKGFENLSEDEVIELVHQSR